MEYAQELFGTFVLLWAVIDPIGTVPVFIAVTRDYEFRMGAFHEDWRLPIGERYRLVYQIDNYRPVNETAVADLKSEISAMEMRIIKAIHEISNK